MTDHSDTKPLIRWTVGDAHPNGLSILRESIRSAQNLFGYEKFDWIICSNAQVKENIHIIKTISNDLGVTIVYPSWSSLPIPLSAIRSAVSSDIVEPRHETFWKVCPPRLRLHSHEIILDNDLVLRRIPPQLEYFLSDVKSILLVEDVHHHGKYHELFNSKQKFNSGLIGLPPGFDFGKAIRQIWEQNHCYSDLTFRDEQGLVTAAAMTIPHYEISNKQIIQLLSTGKIRAAQYKTLSENEISSKVLKSLAITSYCFTGNEYGFHFCESNRRDHLPWRAYQAFFNMGYT